MIDRKLIAQLARDTDAIFSDYRTGPWIQHFAELVSAAALAAQAQDLDALRALVAEMGSEIEDLIEVGSGRLQHDFVSLCPDHMTGHDSRDGDCMACKALIRAQTLIDTARKEG